MEPAEPGGTAVPVPAAGRAGAAVSEPIDPVVGVDMRGADIAAGAPDADAVGAEATVAAPADGIGADVVDVGMGWWGGAALIGWLAAGGLAGAGGDGVAVS